MTEPGFCCPTRSSGSLISSSRQRTHLGLGTGSWRGLWMASHTRPGSTMPWVIQSVWPVTMSPPVLGLPPTREMMRSSAPPTTPDWCLWNMERWAAYLVLLHVYIFICKMVLTLIYQKKYHLTIFQLNRVWSMVNYLSNFVNASEVQGVRRSTQWELIWP